MSVRTLRNWRRLDPEEPAAPPGRPPTPAAELDEARERVRAELDRQGWDAGEGPVWRALEGRVPLARVRRVLRELKAARRRRARQHAREHRTSVAVRARDAVWALDATHLGRDAAGRAVQAEVLREVASTRTLGVWVGPPASAEEVVQLLEGLVRERGGAPLVLLTDNGAVYRSRAVAAWCARHGVLHLFSLPHTPQHNGACEHGMLELKLGAALGAGVLVHDVADARARLLAARDRLDHNRPRRTRGWQTAVQADREAPHWSALVDRQELLAKAACAIAGAVLHSRGRRARRRAIREAILATLEDFHVITRTRGGRPWSAQDSEDVS